MLSYSGFPYRIRVDCDEDDISGEYNFIIEIFDKSNNEILYSLNLDDIEKLNFKDAILTKKDRTSIRIDPDLLDNIDELLSLGKTQHTTIQDIPMLIPANTSRSELVNRPVILNRNGLVRLGKIKGVGSKNIRLQVFDMKTNTSLPSDEEYFEVTALVTKDVYERLVDQE